MVQSEFENLGNLFTCMDERITYHGAKFKMKVDFKEKITERYLKEKFTRGFSNLLSERVLLEPQ